MEDKYLVHKNSSKIYMKDYNGLYMPFFMGYRPLNELGNFYKGNISYEELIQSGFEKIEEKELPKYLDILMEDLTHILFNRKRK